MKKKHFFTFIIIIMMTLLCIPLGIFHEAEAASDSTDFSTTIYTFKEIVIFSYYDDTDIRIEDKYGNKVWSGTLSKDGHHVYTGGAGIYRIFGSKSYTALSGDAVSSYCSGYFGVDQSGRGTSTLINTYMTGSGSFTVFAYEDGTSFTIKDLDTKKLIYAGSLNKGEHLKMPQAPLRRFLQVSANKPVSALCYDDQDYYVPSFNGTFTGELFYGFSGYSHSWTNSITVTAYENDTTVKVVNAETGDTISSYTLGAGQVHADPVTSDVYWKLEASKPVTAANIPYVGYNSGYAYMTRAIDEKGVGAGKHFYVPTIGSRIDVFSFEDDNQVTITCLGRKDEYPYTTKQEVFKGTLNAGQVHTFTSNTGQYVYEIEGTKNVSVLQSNGGAGAEFMPLSYTLGLSDLCVSATDIKFSPEKEAYNEGDTITVEIDVHNYGAEDASNIVVEAYDGDPDGEGTVPVIASKNIDYISSGAFETVSFEYIVPENPEFRNMVVKVDPSDTIRESNSSNNKAIRFINRNHDLEPPIAVSVSAPTGLQINEEGVLEGNPFTITANIFNIGDAAATDVTVKLETLDGLTIAEGNEIINIGTLYQNQQREFNWKISADPKVLGVNRFQIIADASNADAKSVNRSINITSLMVNKNPGITLTTTEDQKVSQAENNHSISFSGKVYDSDGDILTISASINDKQKSVSVNPAPKENPLEDNWTLTWDVVDDGIVEGDYTNIIVTVDDGKGGIETISYNGHIIVDNTPPDQPSIENQKVKGGTEITITSGAPSIGETAWLAPSGTNSFTEGNTMTKLIGDGSTSKIVAPSNEGTYKLFLVDEAGNISQESDNAVTVDNTAPNAPNTPVSQAGNEINALEASGFDVRVDLGSSGAQAEDTIELLVGGNSFTPAKTGTLNSTDITNGFYTFKGITGANLGSDGDYTLTAKITDIVDNEGAQSSPATITIDTIEPNSPTITTPIEEDDKISDAEDEDVVVSGTSEANTAIDVTFTDKDSKTVTAQITADGSGNWTLEADLSSLADGNIDAIVKATDHAGNESTESKASITMDTAAPNKPSVTTPIEEDNKISDAEDEDVVVSGTAEDDAEIEITFEDKNNKTVKANATANGSGSWTLEGAEANLSTLEDGNITVIVKATDSVGNTSEGSTENTILDTTAPNKPSITTPIEEDGLVNKDEKAAVVVNGTTEANAKIEVILKDTKDNKVTKTITADESGNWTLAGGDEANLSTLEDGNITVTVKATDLAGNTSEGSIENFTMDTSVPQNPTVATPIEEDGIVNNYEKGHVEISGKAEINAEIQITFTDGKATITANTTADENGDWTLSGANLSSLADGTITAKVIATDHSGNQSEEMKATFTMDTTPPADQDDVLASEKSVKGGTIITLDAPSSGGADDKIYMAPEGTLAKDLKESETIISTTGDTTTIKVPIQQGSYKVYIMDKAGNVSLPSKASIIVDNTPPSIPTILSVSRQSNRPAIDKDDTPDVLISGLSIGETIKVYDGEKEVGSKIASGSIESITLNSLSEGSHKLIVKVIDRAGNESSSTEEFEYIYDKTAPSKPAIESVSGKSESPAIDNNPNPLMVISHLTVGDTINIYDGEKIVETKTVGKTTEIISLSFLSEGSHTFKVKAIDVAKNESMLSEAFEYIYDSTPPNKPTNTPTSEAAPYINSYEESGGVEVTINLTGTNAQVGDTIELLVDANPFKEPITKVLEEEDIKNGVTLTVEKGQLNGDKVYSITAKITDKAGNIGTESDPLNITLDTSAPNNQVLAMDRAAKGDTTVTLDETAGPDDKIFIAPEGTEGEDLIENGETITNTAGNQINIIAPTKEGKYKVYVTDKSGNASLPSSGTIIVDNTAPSFDEIRKSTDSWTNKDIEITTLFDDGEGSGVTVAKYVYGQEDKGYFSAGGTEIEDEKFKVTHNGVYTIYVKDRAENDHVETIEITNIDKEKPSKPVITRNPDRDFYNDDYIINILSGRDDESGVAETVYQTEGAVNGSWKYYSKTIRISEEGTTEIEAKTIDRAGNESEIEKKVISINRNIHVFPTIKIEPDKEYSNENYKIELITEHDDGYVQESVYSSVYYQITGMDDFEVYDEPFTIDRSGKTDIKVKIIDRSGNENIVTKTVNLDKTKPNNQNDVLKESINKRGEEDIEITPTGDATDTIWLAPEGTTIFTPSNHITKASGDATTINVPSEEGKYRLYVIDRSGNISSPSNAMITVDNTPPTINGVEDEAVYKEYKTITFNDGTAKLNGEDFESGTTIDKNGKYTLVVIDEIGNTRTISFTMDNDEEWVNKDKEALQIGFAQGDSENWVTNDMTLPTAGKNGSFITWQSSDETTIMPNGKVILPNNQQGDQGVTITATITKGNVTQTKTFEVKVISDIVPPTITLVGNSPITLAQGDLYVEKGVQAIDNKDGNITGRVQIEGFVDTNKIGTYILIYKVTDATGNVATVQRIINVVRSTVSENATVEAENDEKIPDQKISDAIDGANQNNEHQVKIIVPDGVTVDKPVKVNISKEQVQKAKDYGISLVLETKDTAIEVPIDAVDTSNMSNNSRLELVCEQVDTTKSENKQMVEAVKNINTNMEIYENKVYDFKMKVVEEDESGNIVNEETVENFTSKNEDIKLRIVVGKDVNEETKLMTFYYNERTGEWEYIRGEYDSETGEMKLLTNHLSIYSVMHLTKEQKQQEMAKILNKSNITIPEALNVIEDPDMEFDPVAVNKYNTLTNAHREDVAKGIINKRPSEGYDYDKLKEKYSEIVTDKYNNINADNKNPVITLIGQDEIWLYVNGTYIEQGATATDNTDGDLTGRIVVIGNVDTSIPGEYTLIYTVRDLNGNTAQAIRKVIVRRKHKSANNDEVPDHQTVPKIEVEESTKIFNDLDGHWAKGIVETLASKGIIAGDNQGNFNPNMGITRAEFATLITKTLNLQIEDRETGFEDIGEDDWYAPYIAAAREAGIVSGISQTQYAPDRIVSRQEMTAMAMRAYRLLQEVKVNDEDISKLDKFTDSEKISAWAHKDVYTAKYLKLVKGREEQNFAPKDKTLRAEAAALIFNLLKALGRI